MMAPLLLIRAPALELAESLQELARLYGWSLRRVRSAAGQNQALAGARPAVFFWWVNPTTDTIPITEAVADLASQHPDLLIVLVSEVKLPEEEQPRITARWLQLGASYVLYPPWTKLVLEDLAGGLMKATIRKLTGQDPPPPLPRGESAIDLAEGVYDEDETS